MGHKHKNDGVFSISLIVNSGYTILEFIAGIATGSLALVADAIHNLTDSITLLVSFIAQRIAQRSPTSGKTYGYGRATIVAALFNGGILISVAVFIGYEAIDRLSEAEEVPGGIVAIVSSIGIVINGSIAWLFSRKKDDLNARSAYTNMFYDTLSSVGAMLSGIIILITGWTILDTLVGVSIAVMLLFATAKIIKEALHILLEGVPYGYSIDAVRATLLAMPEIEDIDDLHVWAISSEYVALSCHLIIDEKLTNKGRQVIEEAKTLLAEKHNIAHSTLELELRECVEHTPHEH